MESENKTQEELVVEQKSAIHQVTPLSKYLAMALFVILPFLGGYVGYNFAPENVVEVEKVSQSTAKETEITKTEFDSVLSELTGGIRDIDRYLTDNETEKMIMNQLKNERYPGSLDDNTLDNFMLTLDELVEKEDFKTIATFIPEQGFFYSVASGPATDRTRVATSQIWTQNQVQNLLPYTRFRELTETIMRERTFSLKTNPTRIFGIHFDSYSFDDNSKKKPTANDFSCAEVTDSVEIEDILALGIQNPYYAGSPEKRDVSFADHFYNCGSGWGGTAVNIYMQPSRGDGSPEIIGAIASFWE